MKGRLASIAVLVIAVCSPGFAVAAEPPPPTAQPAPAPPSSGRVLSLEQALSIADERSPALHQASSSQAVAEAQARQARSSLLPSLTGTASYERATANFPNRPGSVPRSISGLGGQSFTTYNYYQFGLTANQLIYDFGQSTERSKAARATADAARSSTQSTRVTVHLQVRQAYFDARGAKAMLGVAKETLANQQRHLEQIQGFVSAGTRPAIDLAQARADEANARVQLINAQNAYDTARVQLATTIGFQGPADFDVVDEKTAPLPDEGLSSKALVAIALQSRPAMDSLERQLRAAQLTVRAAQGAFGPSLYASTGLTEQGQGLGGFAWNWNAGVTLSWPIAQGGLTRAQVAEDRARVAGVEAQIESLREQVRLDVEKARLALNAAKTALSAADEATSAAHEQLRLAEGRYQTGAGNAIELSDAQLAYSNAEGQQVQAEYNLASARAQLRAALGRP